MEDDGKSTSSQDEWIEGREVATVNIEDREVATDIENIEDREVATNDNEPILPVSEYRTVVIRCNSVLTWVIKPLVGLAFIIGFGVALPDAWELAPWFLLGLVLGVYLLLSTLLNLLIRYTAGGVSWRIMKTNYILQFPSPPVLWFILDTIISGSLLITACVIQPFYWSFGHVVGIIVAILHFVIAVGLLVVRRGNAACMRDVQYSPNYYPAIPILKELLNRLFSAASTQETPVYISTAVKELTLIWKGLNDAETIVSVLKGRRVGNCILLLLVFGLCVVSCVTEFCFIKDWDSWSSHPNHAHFRIYGPFEGVETSLRYWAGFSAVSCIPVLVLLLAGSFRPSVLVNLVTSLISLGVGVYFALLSSYSTMSLILLQENRFQTSASLVFRFMHLLPIPFIAILLISFGISTLLVHLKLDTSTICFQVIKVVSSIPLLVLSPILLTYSIFYSMQELSKHWSNSESENYWSEQKPVQGNLDWEIQNTFTLYMSSEVALASSLLILHLTTLASGRSKIPGPISCVMYLIVLSSSAYAAFALYGQDTTTMELMPWGPVKYAHTGLIVTGLGIGLVGFGRNCISMLVTLVWLIGFPVLCLVFAVVFVFNTVKVCVQQEQVYRGDQEEQLYRGEQEEPVEQEKLLQGEQLNQDIEV